MNMEMYWPQQEVFLMGTLALFSEKLIGEPITLNGEWGYYFNSEDFDSLAQQLNKYKEAGYLEFDEELVKVMSLNPNGAPPFGTQIVSFTIKDVDIAKVTADLTRYLKNWRNDKLLTNAAHKPDDSTHQHDKLLAALARIYDRQDMPRISSADIYGDNADYELPFWETVLAPQLIDNQYIIRQMDYDTNNRELPFVDIKITDTKLHRTLELAASSSKPISDDDPNELEYHGLRIQRDNSVDYHGVAIHLTGQENAALRALMEQPNEFRPREDIATELSVKNSEPTNMAKLISSLRKKLEATIGYNCIENKSGQGWRLKIHPIE